MIQREILRRLLAGFYLLQFSALLLCLSCYSYRVKELVVCWLFFCSLFAALAVILLAAMFSYHAALHLVNWVKVVYAGIPELAAFLAELPQEVILGRQIPAAVVVELPINLYPTTKALNIPSRLLVDAAPSIEDGVPK